MPARLDLLISFMVGDQGSTPQVEVGILVCCTSAAASAQPWIEPLLTPLARSARLVVSDEPSAMIEHMVHHPGPSVIVVLKTADTPPAVVSAFVREFAMRRGGDERLLLRDWPSDGVTSANAVLSALRGSVDALRQRAAPTRVPRTTPTSWVGHPRAPLSDSATFRAGESNDSWLVAPKPVPRLRPWRVWVGFTAAMFATVLLVLVAHLMRHRGQKPRDERTGTESLVSRAAVASVAAPGRALEDPVPALTALEPWFHSGEIRLLDLQLGHFAATPTYTQGEDADLYCRTLRFGVLGGWRLAQDAELRRFEHARILPPGRYWVAGEHALHPRTFRHGASDESSTGIHVACVRNLGSSFSAPR